MLKLLKELLFPKFCLSCGKFGKYICLRCQTFLTPLPAPICFYCEKESSNGKTHEQCSQESFAAVDQFLTIYKYGPVLKKVIAGIKYRLVSDAFFELFELIDSGTQKTLFYDLGGPLYIQAVPLHKKRQKERGFNQSELIAKWLVKKLKGQPINVLERAKETKTQAQLSKKERKNNAEGAFRLKPGASVKGLSLIIVDDVVTTGSTVHAAAAALKAAGASKIGVFSVAKD